MGLKELVDISRRYGADPEFVIAGGGNTSFKDAERLYIKASGTTLASLREDGLVAMRRDRLDAIWDRVYPKDADAREKEALSDLMAARAAGESKRPSVETLLHELLGAPYVVHTHPSLVNGVTCARDGESIVASLFGSDAVWIPTTNPGYILARAVRDRLRARASAGGGEPAILILQNHGIFVAAETTTEIAKIYDRVVNAITGRIGRRPEPSHEDDAAAARDAAAAIRDAVGGESGPVTDGAEPVCLTGGEISRRVESAGAFSALSSFGYTPDHIVYCLVAPAWVPYAADAAGRRAHAIAAVRDFRARYGRPPRVVALERGGVVVFGENDAARDSARDLFLDLLKVVTYAESFGGPRLMPEDQIAFIRGWEVERYRAQISTGSGA